jgi:hypothetical protein
MRIALILPSDKGWRCSICARVFRFFSDYDKHVCGKKVAG